MSIRLIAKGINTSTNNHDLLLNRDLENQHPIKSITDLKEILEKKYEKPVNGIPLKDLDEDVATINLLSSKLDNLKGDILNNHINDVNVINNNLKTLEELVKNLVDNNKINNPNDPTITSNFNFYTGFKEIYITQEDDEYIYLKTSYVVGSGLLKVYREGELLTLGVDYMEEDNQTIKFLYKLEKDMIITLICDSTSVVLSPIHEEVTLVEKNQKIVKLKNNYIVGKDILSVYIKGLRLENKIDYKEIDLNTIELTKDYDINTKVILRQEAMGTPGEIIYKDKLYKQKSWKQVFIAEKDNVSQIISHETFIPKQDMLNVMYQGILLTEGEVYDYVEVDENTINLNFELYKDEKIVLECIYETSDFKIKYITNGVSNIINLDKLYNPNCNELLVYENGILLEVEEDYIELSCNKIKFIETSPIGSVITIIRRR